MGGWREGGVDGYMDGWTDGWMALTLRCGWSSPEQKRRGGRRDQMSRRMVALYDYDPRESSPNVDVEVGGAADVAQA